ncbi:serine/threonine protein kinase [Chroococcidiopsis sp. CCALA 051]|uniref:serine/threonine-protein kinase n=1 Tax=Chroococcidiopsis sp. CCALA 051 TaxID=869949 RepID=UPI000D0D5CDC|nr:serine/threonine-protein kinase [Chroococcidiopsis sp. CCALA 051]PSM51189.1 serine/threonine protein kinase [Chroococcidiopsis sp. CCALA 051]
MNQPPLQPPLQLGTVLQNRYRVDRVLGQGGFGRTYLAEDLGRFNELCALKELIPAQADNYTLEKSQQLFQREAAILYQIQHPQVPQFRATFEEDRRLFLVQDYVAGKTYRTLLDEYQANGQTFSEAEVFHLLKQLLPVLAHIHARGIIHRDISPDNIILRESDAKPVLIDFGVVKELATRFQSSNSTPAQATTVGKLGYAPSEQIQTGRAYPSSDLYALAVTVVVLLTGREPQELFDDLTLVWHWQRWATVMPGFAQILNRMLSYKPNDRYQNVAEVAKALQAIEPQIAQSPAALATPTPSLNQSPVIYSQALNLVPGSSSDVTGSLRANVTVNYTFVAERGQQLSAALAQEGVLLTVLGPDKQAIADASQVTSYQGTLPSTGIYTVQLTPAPGVDESQYQLNLSLASAVTPTPTPTLPAASPASPTVEVPTAETETINFAEGQSRTQVSGRTSRQQIQRYLVNLEEGQQLSVIVTRGAVTLDVRDPDGNVLKGRNEFHWQGRVKRSGQYQIDVVPLANNEVEFGVNVGVYK